MNMSRLLGNLLYVLELVFVVKRSGYNHIMTEKVGTTKAGRGGKG